MLLTSADRPAGVLTLTPMLPARPKYLNGLSKTAAAGWLLRRACNEGGVVHADAGGKALSGSSSTTCSPDALVPLLLLLLPLLAGRLASAGSVRLRALRLPVTMLPQIVIKRVEWVQLQPAALRSSHSLHGTGHAPRPNPNSRCLQLCCYMCCKWTALLACVTKVRVL